ncbi:MAG: hypothetical protein MSA56_05705 [Clostridium sp.]|nr:hypothetical protein [Clostridium sp.]
MGKETHGLRHTRIYNIWNGMKIRCYDKNNRNYSKYGQKGIKVCDEWKNNFINFYEWSINNGYTDNLTLDRIDTKGNYTPENCRWTTQKIQQNNRSNNKIIEYQNKKYTISELADAFDMEYNLVADRIRKGWDIDKIINTPKNSNLKLLTYNNETHTLMEWSRITGIERRTISQRLKYGWDIEKALTVSPEVYKNRKSKRR